MGCAFFSLDKGFTSLGVGPNHPTCQESLPALRISESFDSIESQSESFDSIESQNVISLTNTNGPSEPLKAL